MLIEKSAMRTEAVFSDDRKHRYLLRKEWDAKKPKATIIMTNPSTADLHMMDYTSLFTINNLVKLDFGSVDIVNMDSKPTTKLNTKEELHLNAENVEQILKSAAKADKIIIAWGKLGENNKKIRLVQLKLLEMLKPFKDKLYIIASEDGESGFHPLASKIRFTWDLQKFALPEHLQEKNDTEQERIAQDKQLQKEEQAATESE